MKYEQTIAKPAEVEGTGLHTGVRCRMKLVPAAAGRGIVFRRVDLDGFEVEARAANIARVSYATSLMKKGVLISTTEHLLAALYSAAIDNVIVELDNLELPILDGSAQPFTEMLTAAGRRTQRRRRRYLQIVQPVEVRQQMPATLSAEPTPRRLALHPANSGPGLAIDCTIEFAHPLIGRQRLDLGVDDKSFRSELAGARTFCFHHEVEQLKQMGLIRGGSLDCALVLTADGLMNAGGLRFPDEFCRHKVLDLIGDLALVGRPLVGRVVAERAGHALHTALVRELLRTRAAWREVTLDQLAAVPAPV